MTAATAPGTLWSSWTFQPLVVVGMCLGAWVYLRGVRAAWRGRSPGRGIRRGQVVAFAGGLAALAVALISPLDALSEDLLSAHMAQHLLLLMVAPLLLVLGSPVLSMTMAIPPAWRRMGRRMARRPGVRAVGRALTHPLTTWLLALIALWAWHAPALYQGALQHEGIHLLEHASFLGTALLFWWTALQPSGPRRLPRGADVLYVFTGSLPGAALGALFAFASAPLYPLYAVRVSVWGLTPLQDQQLAGVIMWIPSGVIYLGVSAWLFVRWLGALDREQRRREARREPVRSPLTGSEATA